MKTDELTEEEKQAQRQEKDKGNEPQTAEDLSVQGNRQVTQPGEHPNVHNVNGRDKDGVPGLLTSHGKSNQARDNDSDTANGLMRFKDNEDSEQTPQVTDKFKDESVK